MKNFSRIASMKDKVSTLDGYSNSEEAIADVHYLLRYIESLAEHKKSVTARKRSLNAKRRRGTISVDEFEELGGLCQKLEPTLEKRQSELQMMKDRIFAEVFGEF